MFTSSNKIRLTSVLLIFGMLFSLISASPARAAVTITVNTDADNFEDDGLCTLREAITAANTNAPVNGADDCNHDGFAGTDTIYFAADYTMTLSDQLPPVTTTLIINGNGAANTIVEASTCNPVTLPGGCTRAAHRVFHVAVGGNLTLDSLTVRHGRPANDNGGGIYNSGTLTMTNSTFSANSAYEGGGVYNQNTLTVTNSALSGNYAGGYGGGIYSDGALTVTESSFSGNSAAAYGAGIFKNGTTTVTNSTFSGNSASHGGGIFNLSGDLTVTNSTLSGNSVSVSGGGIYANGPTTVTNSTLSGNSASYDGGGIFTSGTTTVTNSTFSANSAGSIGGGINNYVGTLTLKNSTLSGNSATAYGGGIYINVSGTLNYANTIIANSTRQDCDNDGAIGTNTNNLVEDNTCSPMLSGDPMLEPLQDNGGPTQTMSLDSASAAIGSGDPTVCAIAPVSGLDQRGVARDANCDIGAYEYVSVPTDTTPPVVTVPSDITEEATSASGATVNFVTSATDSVSPANPSVTCDWPSGSTFPIGTTPVTCQATDDAGNTGYGYFNVTVQDTDTTAPVVTVPSDITAEAVSASGATVSFLTSATDSVSPANPSVTCDWPSGSTFPIGTTPVTCSATDDAGNTGFGYFNVIVQDTTDPVLTIPADVRRVEATGAAGAVVTFSASATDAVGVIAVACIPPSGATFPLGVTSVGCKALDAAGNSSFDSFNITVQDTTDPVVTVPADIIVVSPDPFGATTVVDFVTSATDAVSPLNPSVTCDWPSGSAFPDGVVTPVTCWATDDAGNTGYGYFDVTVIEATLFRSDYSKDGYVRESKENSSAGGTFFPLGGYLILGDDDYDRQYRAILHFDTSRLPEGAVITGMTLKIKRAYTTGNNPFTTHGSLTVDIGHPHFGSSVNLMRHDFQALPGAVNVGSFVPAGDDWYSTILSPSAFSWLNLGGPTQFRLRFSLGDNDDNAPDYLSFISAGYIDIFNYPQLIVEWYVP